VRPLVVAWLLRHGLAAWLAPDYFTLVAIGTLVASVITLRLARRDGARSDEEARTVLIAYAAALGGGYAFEVLRAIPSAIAAGSLAPLAHVGRAAYGGLLAAVGATALYRRWRGLPIAGFLDRAGVGTGVVFAFVRTGCFLAGCDYGVTTSSALGVRFPPDSPAAIDHALRGFVPDGAASLPVHATQLYEALLGAAASLVAYVILRRRARRDGLAFIAWLSLYAAGRFSTELLRGDATRGAYLGLSTAQWVSLTILTICAAILFARAAANRRIPALQPTAR